MLVKKVQQDTESMLIAIKNERIIATELMKKAEELLKKREYNDVKITVAVNDEELQKFYERRGYEKGGTYVWMTKQLSSQLPKYLNSIHL